MAIAVEVSNFDIPRPQTVTESHGRLERAIAHAEHQSDVVAPGVREEQIKMAVFIEITDPHREDSGRRQGIGDCRLECAISVAEMDGYASVVHPHDQIQ